MPAIMPALCSNMLACYYSQIMLGIIDASLERTSLASRPSVRKGAGKNTDGLRDYTRSARPSAYFDLARAVSFDAIVVNLGLIS